MYACGQRSSHKPLALQLDRFYDTHRARVLITSGTGVLDTPNSHYPLAAGAGEELGVVVLAGLAILVVVGEEVPVETPVLPEVLYSVHSNMVERDILGKDVASRSCWL